MDSATLLRTSSSLSSCSALVSRISSCSCNSYHAFDNRTSKNNNLRFGCVNGKEKRRLHAKSLRSVHLCSTQGQTRSCFSVPLDDHRRPFKTSGSVIGKVGCIVSEFESLKEPIDRVKRLLDYATLLPELPDSERVPANRVAGCAVQVWLSVSMSEEEEEEEFGRMRFAADSDSEIAKGFCSCLVWILDGAFPEEVLRLKKEDLEALNVGLHGRAQSRVNTWHNVLIDMQKRTQVLVADRVSKSFIRKLKRSGERAKKLVC